jgi:hypothetical protein
MRHWIRSHLTYANVVATLSLFLVLGGTTLAATGGNFILGQPNGAGAPTSLTSPTTNTAGTLKVANTAASGGRAIQGTSAHGQGVYGHSDSNAGVVGDSNTFDGVFGTSNDSDSAGVSGHGDGGGYGVFASGGSRANHTAAIHGQSGAGNAIQGYSTANPASGVYGQDNNADSYGVAGHSDNGVAVVGDSSNGWAMQALGQATQSRNKSGFIKAMAFVDPTNATNQIGQCFSSQRPPGQAASGHCGMSYSKLNTGQYVIDLGFKVDDRLPSVTPYVDGVTGTASLTAGVTGVRVATWKNGYVNSPFYVFVF